MKNAIKDIFSTMMYLAGVVLVCFCIQHFVCQVTVVSGGSMEPTYHDGNRVLLDKISYRFREPQRFDVIVFPYTYDKDMLYIKRIIGLPGETVFIDDTGDIYIDNVLLTEGFGSETMLDNGCAGTPITLGKDEYFVLGDNRNGSQDSRDPLVGNIKRESILGRSLVKLW